MNQRVVKGADLEYSSDGGTSWVKVPNVKAVPIPSVDIDYQESTSIDGDGSRTYIPGLRDWGELSVGVGYESATYGAMVGFQNAATLLKWRTTLPIGPEQATADTVEYDGYVRAEAEQNGAGEIQMFNLNLRITGEPVFTEGTAA